MDILYKYNDVIFEWDSDKADRVLKEHNITMQEACTVFFDENEITMRDTRFNYGEERYITVGLSNKIRLLVVAWTDRENIRLITAMKAGKKYENKYRRR